MAEATVFSKEGTEKGKTALNEALFEAKINEPLMYEYVTGYLRNQRQGNAKGKRRGEVSGGGIKPFRQKGTGRARAGSNTSPLWVRGGKAFAPVPHGYHSPIPRQKRRGAFLSALSLKANEKAVRVLEDLSVTAPKTREVASVLKAMNLEGRKTLLVVDRFDKNLFLAARNLAKTAIRKVGELNAFDVLDCETVVFTKKSLKELQAKFGKAGE